MKDRLLCEIDQKELFQIDELVGALASCTTEFGMSFEVIFNSWEIISSNYKLERERAVYCLKLIWEEAVPIQKFLEALWKISNTQNIAIKLHERWCEKFGVSNQTSNSNSNSYVTKKQLWIQIKEKEIS